MRNHNNDTSSYSLVIGGILSLFLVHVWVASGAANLDYDELALGQETTGAFAEHDGLKVHCQYITDYAECESNYQSDAKLNQRSLVLWLGNSQIQSINKMSTGETVAPARVHEELRASGYYLLTMSQPNANLQEHYVVLEHLLARLHVEALILPVVFDDLRNSDVREELSAALEDKRTIESLNQTEIGRSLVEAYLEKPVVNSELSGLEGTTQEQVEAWLNRKLEDNWLVWAERADIRSRFFLLLYQLRNSVLGINPSTVRKMIRPNYTANMSALTAIIETAEREGIKTLIYVAPIRQDVTIPYDKEEYLAFKTIIEGLDDVGGVTAVNLEDIVPDEYWGMKASTNVTGEAELDFMHFQYEGHEILAREITKRTIALLKKSS